MDLRGVFKKIQKERKYTTLLLLFLFTKIALQQCIVEHLIKFCIIIKLNHLINYNCFYNRIFNNNICITKDVNITCFCPPQ